MANHHNKLHEDKKQQITLTSHHWGGLPTIWIPSSYRNTFQHQSSYNDLYPTSLVPYFRYKMTIPPDTRTSQNNMDMKWLFLSEGGSVLSACATYRIYYGVWYLSHSRDHYGRLLSTYPLLTPTSQQRLVHTQSHTSTTMTPVSTTSHIHNGWQQKTYKTI